MSATKKCYECKMPLPAAAVLVPIIIKGGMVVGGAASTLATGYDAYKEYSAYGKGESVFNTNKERADHIKEVFLKSCKENPKFSKDCPNNPDNQKQDGQKQAGDQAQSPQGSPISPDFMNKYGNIIALGGLFLFVLVVKFLRKFLLKEP